MVVIHYSGVDADSGALQIAEYQTTKKEGDLFPECAYSFVVRRDGRIEQCHDLETRTWHAGGRNNDRGIGVCLPGSGWPAPAQLDSTAALIRALARELGRGEIALYGMWGIGDAETRGVDMPEGMSTGDAERRGAEAEQVLLVAGHKELSATLCPGPYWDSWKEGLLPVSPSPCPPVSASPCPVVLGFRQLYDYLGAEKCGVPLAPERYDEQGNSRQPFSRCEMRWDKAENRVWVSFQV